jgi:hypothetical protein
MNSLVRLYLGFENQLPESTKLAIKTVMLNFKYWMDQGEHDSMCYWSENHQILFATEEYLVGQTFPDDIFTIDGKTGREHMAMAKVRIEAWMQQRYLYGFTEWYSNNYYPEDIGPMANFIQFSEDDELVNRMRMIMDIIWFDMASQSFRFEGEDTSGAPRTYYIFVSSSGRMYSDNRISDDVGNRMRNFIDFVMQPEETKAFENSWFTSKNGFFNCFRQMIEAKDTLGHPFYTVPEVIKSVFDDSSEAKIIKSSQSLNVSELEAEGLIGQADHQIMMQLNMEAFTNPEVIDNTMRYIAKNKMFTNDFLNDFKLINLWPLRAFGLLESVSRILNPSTNGVAIERANVYTYKTPYYSMNTAQAYHAGEYADQHAINSVNLSNKVSIFTTQPAKIPRRSGTPTYWTGNGRQPYSVQERNVNISIYIPPLKTGFMEPMVVKETTHVYFPKQLFDEYDLSHLQEGYAFARVGAAYVAILSRYPMQYVPFSESNIEQNKDDMLVRGSAKEVLTDDYDLVQTGSGTHYFITELSSSQIETFASFINRIMANELLFENDNNSITYKTMLDQQTTITELKAVYAKSFSINGVIQNLEYPRYDNPYVENGIVERKADTITYIFDSKSLRLNYQANTREVDD